MIHTTLIFRHTSLMEIDDGSIQYLLSLSKSSCWTFKIILLLDRSNLVQELDCSFACSFTSSFALVLEADDDGEGSC